MVIAGIISIWLSIQCFNMDAGETCSCSTYGGDAFTGIQNAGALTAKNVRALSEISRKGFGGVLLVGGVALIGFSIQERGKEDR